jgi:hypothetical protein
LMTAAVKVQPFLIFGISARFGVSWQLNLA